MPEGKCRIIAGKWRGRKLLFPAEPGLRPTPDRVRETLFNWLNQALPQARCLDLFSGSGSLGIEALSRGASEVIFIENNAKAAKAIQANLDTFGAIDATVIQHDVMTTLAKKTFEPFDVIFVDPPYRLALAEPVCTLIDKLKLLKPGGMLYLETEAKLRDLTLPSHWQMHRELVAGQVKAHLVKN